MSSTYRYHHNPDDGSGVFIDARSGKSFPHEGGKRAALSKTQARQAMLVEQAAMDRAQELRPKPKPAVLTREERVQSVTHLSQPFSGSEAGAQNRLEYLQRRLNSAMTPEDKAKIERRIAAAQTAGERGARKQATKDQRAAEQADPRFLQTVQRSEELYRAMLNNPTVDAGMLENQRLAVANLKLSRDYLSYDQHEEQTLKAFDFARQSRIESMSAGLEQAKLELRAAKLEPGLAAEGGTPNAS